ncbi:putative anion transporter 5 [Forsythia ovata]|uniref:Anion transporter 5 n=1 Tax=Forsythia ovata TaxID=205694 RepID=A0ABD1WTX5_9LAMI
MTKERPSEGGQLEHGGRKGSHTRSYGFMHLARRCCPWLHLPSIHTALAQWLPPHERSRSVSPTTYGINFGAAVGMLVLPSLVKFRGPQSVFLGEAALGAMRMWTLLWFKYANDPPRSEHPKATVAGFGELLLPIKGNQKMKVDNGEHSIRTPKIPCKKIIFSLPVWAIVVNYFTFPYALYMLMNWLPTYFELVLQVRHGIFQDDALLVGVIADHLITKRLLSVIRRRTFKYQWICGGFFCINGSSQVENT